MPDRDYPWEVMEREDIDFATLSSGNKWAWDEFVNRFSPFILAAARKILSGRSEEDIEDAVQSVFLRLVKDDYRLLKSYDATRAKLSTWLTIVARSVALDSVKRPALPSVPIDAGVMEIAAPAPVEEQHLEIPPDLLSPRQKLVLHLLYDKDMPVEEAARLLNVNAQTIRSTRHKAVERLRAHFRSGNI